ncbi:unnamed protein product [Agarophyton chilense]
MEEALKLRKGARDAFYRARKELALVKVGRSFEMGLRDLALEKGKSRLGKFLRRQRRFLDAVTAVIEKASDGHQIHESILFCEKQKWDPTQYDITVEIDQLFHSVVTSPTTKLRSFVDKNVSTTLGKFAKNLLRRIIQPPLEVLIGMGNTLLATYLKLDDISEQKKRLQVSILRIFMYVSDCYRYIFDPKKAKSTAELMRFSDSTDAEAYMRIAMNAAVETDCDQDITPFFHYCVFLDNRNVAIESTEAKLVHRYVKVLRDTMDEKAMGSCPLRETVILVFVDAIWALLVADMKEASSKVRDEQLWKALVEYVNAASQKNVLHMAGAVMFSHHRSAVKKTGSSTNPLVWEVADYLLFRFIFVLSESVSDRLKQARTLIRNRKRNRRRAMQKKRKKDATTTVVDGAELNAFEALRHVGPLEELVPHLGTLSFMAHYLALKKESVGHANDDHVSAKVLQGLRSVVNEIRLFNELTCTLRLSDYVESRQAKSSRVLPPLHEDVMLGNFLLCDRLGMLKSVQLDSATLETVFNAGPPNIAEVICDESSGTYETFVEGTAVRYSKVFAMQSAQEAKFNADELGLPATQSITATAIRKQRILTLISELEKLGGGRIARMLIQVPKIPRTEAPVSKRDSSLSPPLPGQPYFQECQTHEEEETFNIDVHLTKRRRIIGSCTPGHSEAQRALHSGGENDLVASDSPFVSDNHYGASQRTIQKQTNSTKQLGTDVNVYSGRCSGEPSHSTPQTRRPVHDDEVAFQDELLPAESYSTAFRLQQLMYPDHKHSMSGLWCGIPENPVWRVPCSEPSYVNITTFSALEYFTREGCDKTFDKTQRTF